MQAEIRVFEDRLKTLFRDHGIDGSTYLLGEDSDQPIHVIEAGQGRPLVLIHGGGGVAAEWAPLLPFLQKDFRCVAIDRPGHGGTYRVDYRRIPDYRAHAAAFVGRTLDLLGLERATLVGNSIGAFFSLAFALEHPERVDRLALLGAPAGVERSIPLLLRLLGQPGLGPLLWKTVARPSEQGMRDFYGRLLVADGDHVSESVIACGLASLRIPGADVAWLTLLRRFLNLRGVRPPWYLRDDVARLTIPTLFVWGDRDAFAPPSSGRELCERMPNAAIEVIPGAGHLPWIDAPEPCARALRAFVAA